MTDTTRYSLDKEDERMDSNANYGYTTVMAACGDVMDELLAAVDKFAPFNSAHEGFAVLKEEVDELWDEVRAKQGARDVARMDREAVQVAAMALRFLLDVTRARRGQV